METYREEIDSMGEIKIADSKYWGAQTQRSLENFVIGKEHIPEEVIKSLAIIKKAAACANSDLGILSGEKASLIKQVSDEILSGDLEGNFPLVVWQTGSGTQTNMNVNEVISNRCSKLTGEKLGSKIPVHPNDDVNKSQSSNDVFPVSMHISAYIMINKKMLPILEELIKSLKEKALEFKDVVKVGRTHLQDAVPITLGQEFKTYAAQLESAKYHIKQISKALLYIPIGGTAVGTGLNAPNRFDSLTAKYISEFTECKFRASQNKCEQMAAHDVFAILSGGLKTLACALYKIANDIRLLSSGPNCGLSEIIIPSNEPGSSIMPGKVNPTQSEAMTMVCIQVMGNDTAITFACSQGHLELNVYKPLIIFNTLNSIRLLSDACSSFKKNLVDGIKVNSKKIKYYLNNSLMVVTALNPVIGYDSVAKLVHYAEENDVTLKEACLALNLLSLDEFEKYVDPSKMV